VSTAPPSAETTASTLGRDAPPPRRLQLSTILLQLVASARHRGPEREPSGRERQQAQIDTTAPIDCPVEQTTGAPTAARHARRRRRRRVVSNLTVGEMVDRTQQAGFGFVIALLAIMSLPFPGISVPFGLAIALGALQMMLGLRRPWLPQFISRYQVSLRTLIWIERRLYTWTRGLERVVRPRFELFTRGPFWNLCGVGVLAMAVGLSLPLPIPFSNVFFIVPLVIYAIGLLEADGLLIMLGHAIVAVDLMLAVWFGDIVVSAVRAAVEAVTGLFGMICLV
jgi:hypothetical protein